MNDILHLRPNTKAEKKTHSTTDTIALTPDMARSWKTPDCQRPTRTNELVKEIAKSIKSDLVIPGILTLGVMNGETYVINGRHRIEAFLLSEVREAYVDIQVYQCKSQREMSELFEQLNGSIAPMKPDDFLRSKEVYNQHLKRIRLACPYVGYDYIRRGPTAPILSMSALLRAWYSSAADTPSSRATTSKQAADLLTEDDTTHLLEFMSLAHRAWGRESQNFRLWATLNLVLCMWCFRRYTANQKNPKLTRLSKDVFMKCLMSLSADEDYRGWVVGRRLSELDRSPCYRRIKEIFAKRIRVETGAKAQLIQPEWASH